MRPFFVPVAAVLLAAIAMFATQPGPLPAAHPEGVAVVELFTSEGCSSCPPADRVLADIAAEDIPGVFPLAFHVDYWDRLGWKDEFARPYFTTRQRQHSRAMNLRGVYTPQVVVNHDDAVGSNVRDVRRLIADALSRPATVRLSPTVTRAADTVTVRTTSAGGAGKGTMLTAVLVQPSAETAVARGENAGRRLKHVRLVRDHAETPLQNETVVTLTVPEDVRNPSVVVFATEDGRVVGAAEAK